MYEYTNGDWTYHAKGAYFYENENPHPEMTIIGSSNFSHRSNRRDTEMQLYIVPDCENFKKRMHDECEHLFEKADKKTIEELEDKDNKQYKITWKDKIIRKLFSFAL